VTPCGSAEEGRVEIPKRKGGGHDDPRDSSGVGLPTRGLRGSGSGGTGMGLLTGARERGPKPSSFSFNESSLDNSRPTSKGGSVPDHAWRRTYSRIDVFARE
jgi:hypothetical protein